MVTYDSKPFHTMCLLLSVLGCKFKPQLTGKLFEKVSGEVIKNYINGNVIVCGFPKKISIKDLASNLNETFNHGPKKYAKDCGLDVISWKSFEDKRGGQIVILFQSSSGDNWKTKLSDLSISHWHMYIEWCCYELVKGFTFPYIITDIDDFKHYSRRGGILFDRSRIYRNISNIPTDLNTQILTWCNNLLRSLR